MNQMFDVLVSRLKIYPCTISCPKCEIANLTSLWLIASHPLFPYWLQYTPCTTSSPLSYIFYTHFIAKLIILIFSFPEAFFGQIFPTNIILTKLNLTHNLDLVEVACILAQLARLGLRFLHANLYVEVQTMGTNEITLQKWASHREKERGSQKSSEELQLYI